MRVWIAALGLGLCSLATAQRADPALAKLLREGARTDPALATVMRSPERFELQVLWTRIQRVGSTWRTTTQSFGLDPRRWFSAASLVKLPLALFALEELQRRGLPLSGTSLQATLPAECTPALASGGDLPPVAEPLTRTLTRLLVVSDNEAYNRLYQWLGPPFSQQRLLAYGMPDARITRPLMVCTEPALDQLGHWQLQTADQRVVASGPARSTGPRPRFKWGKALRGRNWIENGKLQPGPHDFSDSNFLSLPQMQKFLMAAVRPELLPADQRLNMRESDRLWLREKLRTVPSEVADPAYPAEYFPDYMGKYLLLGDGSPRPPGLRIYNKIGQSYGYLSDVAYFEEGTGNEGFFLSAVVFVDTDGTLNDGNYAYKEIGLPFLASLGRLILAEEHRLRATPGIRN